MNWIVQFVLMLSIVTVLLRAMAVIKPEYTALIFTIFVASVLPCEYQRNHVPAGQALAVVASICIAIKSGI